MASFPKGSISCCWNRPQAHLAVLPSCPGEWPLTLQPPLVSNPSLEAPQRRQQRAPTTETKDPRLRLLLMVLGPTSWSSRRQPQWNNQVPIGCQTPAQCALLRQPWDVGTLHPCCVNAAPKPPVAEAGPALGCSPHAPHAVPSPQLPCSCQTPEPSLTVCGCHAEGRRSARRCSCRGQMQPGLGRWAA